MRMVCRFGGGAMVGAPLKERLLRYWSAPPDFLGSVNDLHLQTVEGVRYAVGKDGALREVQDSSKNEQ